MSNSVIAQGSQTAHSYNHSSKISSPELLEISESNERTLTPHEEEHKSGDAVSVGIDSAKVSSRGGAQSSHDTVKPRKVYGFLNESTSDGNYHTSQLKLPILQEDNLSKMKIHHPHGDMEHTIDVESVLVSSAEDASNLAADEKVDTNVLVRALHNLSDLLLLHCSNDEGAPTEKDQEALDHIIRNLDVCMSRKTQQVVPTKNLMMFQQKSSNMFQEVTNEATGIYHGHQAGNRRGHYQKRNDDIFGKNVEKLQGCTSLRDEADLPKDHSMIQPEQAIKKILDESLECKEELPSQALLFKNLWLEAEAKLCAFNYKARFECMKRDMEKWKLDKATVLDASESAVAKKITSFNGSDLNTSPQPMHEADGSKVSNTLVQIYRVSSVDSHVDDVEASMMGHFNILKHHGELNPDNFEEQDLSDDQVSGKENQGFGVTLQSHLQHHLCKDDAVVNASGSDVEPSIMARLNMLKRRGASVTVGDVEEQIEGSEAEVFGKESRRFNGIMGSHSQDEANKEAAAHGIGLMQNQFNSGWFHTSYSSSDWEHIVKDEFSWQTNGRLN